MGMIRELGHDLTTEQLDAVKRFPLLRANFIDVRNTPAARVFLNAWLDANRDHLLAPEPDPDREADFHWHTPEQCAFGVVAARAVVRGELPPHYPGSALWPDASELSCETMRECDGLARK